MHDLASASAAPPGAAAPAERIVVAGAGMAGLMLALCLARAGGFEVVLVERDPAPPEGDPGDAFGTWQRRGVAQFRHAHFFHPRFRQLLHERFPQILADMLAAGARELPVRDALPPALRPRYRPQPEDAQAVLLMARRATVEAVLRRYAQAHPAITILPETWITGITLDRDRDPAVATGLAVACRGARRTLPASVVVDATGRSSRFAAWLEAAGIAPAVATATPIDLHYYTRHYALAPDGGPEAVDFRPVSGSQDGVGYAVCPGDRATFAVVLSVREAATVLRRRLATGDGFQAVAMDLPEVRAWVDPARAAPLTEPAGMTGFRNLWRRYTAAGRPRVLGFFAVGDASAGSNPAYGSGCSWAVLQAALLAQTLTETADPGTRAVRLEQLLDREVRPFFEHMHRRDRGVARRAGPADAAPRGGWRRWAQALVQVARAEDPLLARRLLEQRYLMRVLDPRRDGLFLLARLTRTLPVWLAREGPRAAWRELRRHASAAWT